MGDLELASKSFVERDPNYGLSQQGGDKFYDELAQKYKKQAEAKGGIAVVIRYPFSWGADNEDKRFDKAFRKRGIRVIEINQYNQEDNRTLEIADDAVYFVNKKKNRRKKVGLVIIDGEFADFDATNRSSMKRYVLADIEWNIETYQGKIIELEGKTDNKSEKQLKRAKKYIEMLESLKTEVEGISSKQLRKIKKALRKSGYRKLVREITKDGFPGLIDAYSQGKVDLINGPGTESVNDKEFYLYVPEMIRSLQSEEPIIQNIPTISFASGDSLNEDLFARVFERNENDEYVNRSKLVIKKVVGRGGEAVWVGPKIEDEEFGKLEDAIKESPSDYIVQVYFALSQLEGYIVDLRYITDVSADSDKTIVAPFPWGRGVEFEGGNGKVNISDKGGETAVFIKKEAEEVAVAALIKYSIKFWGFSSFFCLRKKDKNA